MDYSHFLSGLSANRRPNTIRELSKVLAKASPDMIPLSGGFPNPELFPFLRVVIDIPGLQSLEIAGDQMAKALQYLPSKGLPELVEWIDQLQSTIHQPPIETEVIVTPGSLDGLCKTVEMLMEMGDAVVVEEFIYAGVLSMLTPYNPEFIIAKTDKDGMDPDSLRQALLKAKKKPKFIYINPNGGNPSGCILSKSRRYEIYRIASEHNLLILEDDPYYFIQFIEEKYPSFLSMDVDGRVIRFDSFSKIISAGMRLGWVTGPKELISRIEMHMQSCVMNASSLSQMFTIRLLKHWGMSVFWQHVATVEAFYRVRRDVMQKAAQKHLTDLCEWNTPSGGMFFWLKVKGVADTWDMVTKRAIEKNVILVPGRAFSTNPDHQESAYLRATFSIAQESDFDLAFRRLAELIRDELAATNMNGHS